MRAYYHTWKFGGQEKTFIYHGAMITVDAVNAVMTVSRPEMDSGLGLQTIVPFINTDEITIESCSTTAVGTPGTPGYVPPCNVTHHFTQKNAGV